MEFLTLNIIEITDSGAPSFRTWASVAMLLKPATITIKQDVKSASWTVDLYQSGRAHGTRSLTRLVYHIHLSLQGNEDYRDALHLNPWEQT